MRLSIGIKALAGGFTSRIGKDKVGLGPSKGRSGQGRDESDESELHVAGFGVFGVGCIVMLG